MIGGIAAAQYPYPLVIATARMNPTYLSTTTPSVALPAGILSGDRLVTAFHQGAGAGNLPASPVSYLADGWDLECDIGALGNRGGRMCVFSKEAVGDESGDVVAQAFPGTNSSAAVVVVLRPERVPASTWLDEDSVTGTGQSSTSSPVMTAPASCRALTIVASDVGSQFDGVTYQDGVAGQMFLDVQGSNHIISVFEQTVDQPGAVGARSYSRNAVGGGGANAAFMIARFLL